MTPRRVRSDAGLRHGRANVCAERAASLSFEADRRGLLPLRRDERRRHLPIATCFSYSSRTFDRDQALLTRRRGWPPAAVGFSKLFSSPPVRESRAAVNLPDLNQGFNQMLIAGTCSITEPIMSPTGQVITPPVVTGTGLARAIAEATMAPGPIGSTSQTSLQSWCNRVAAAIVEHFVTNGLISVTTPAGIPVTTAGTAAAQTGMTTGPGMGTGSLS